MTDLPPAGPPARPPVRGAILAGGASTRLGGRPKGLELVGNLRILDRLVTAFETGLGRRPILIANAAEAPSWRSDLEVISDLKPGYGALSGLHSAISWGPGPVVVTAWDMPFVPAELLAELAAGLGDRDAFLPESTGPRGVEPMCAAYGPACRPAIESRMAAGDLRAVSFHDSVKVGILSMARVRRLGDPELLFFNVNTADDLAKADQLWRRHASSRL
jgi:molybdopterin-guanine dinucleotide biosynthesis protein A